MVEPMKVASAKVKRFTEDTGQPLAWTQSGSLKRVGAARSAYGRFSEPPATNAYFESVLRRAPPLAVMFPVAKTAPSPLIVPLTLRSPLTKR
jgi:hypothetical protein